MTSKQLPEGVAHPVNVDLPFAAGYLDIGVDALEELVDRREIPWFRVGNRKKFNLRALDKWSEERAWQGMAPGARLEADPPLDLADAKRTYRKQRQTA